MTLPHRPSIVSAYAQACLAALGATDFGGFISLRGAFGLAHYYEYRGIRDVDAWWVESATRDERSDGECARKCTAPLWRRAQTLLGRCCERGIAGGTLHRFQLSDYQKVRVLEPAVHGVWPGGIGIDSFRDLVASKMAALVERGAPRDLLDAHTLCTKKQCGIADCWNWWASRQALANEIADRNRAALAIRTHLARLEQARPLAAIADIAQRNAATALRAWFDQEFLRELSD